MFVRPITRAAVCRHSMGGGVLNSTTTTMAASWLGHRLSLPTTASASSIGAATTSLGARWITSTSFILPDPTVHEGERRHVSNLQLTKIVATIGPTSEQAEPLRRVVDAGMRIMRLNFSHATKDEVELRMTNLALAQVCMNQQYQPVPRGKSSLRVVFSCLGHWQHSPRWISALLSFGAVSILS